MTIFQMIHPSTVVRRISLIIVNPIKFQAIGISIFHRPFIKIDKTVFSLCIISELQKSIKTNKVISYLSGETEAREKTKGADYGGTT